MEKLTNLPYVFFTTGAVYTAAISNTTELLYYYVGIGRHNAIDKCIGNALINDVGLTSKILLVTYRTSVKIITKLINRGISIVISHGPLIACSIELGEKFGITSIGFCRGSRFIVYTHMSRIQD